MFYHIGPETTLLNQVNPGLSLDNGWTNRGNVWYKGYSTDCVLSDNIDKIILGYKPSGIWCVIQHTGDEYQVYYPSTRGFPEYVDGQVRSNLIGTTMIPVEISASSFDDTHTDVNKTVTNIKEYLLSNILGFHKYNNSEMNIWCTGGIDSLSIVAIYEYAKIPYNIYIAKPKTEFLGTRHFEGSITEYSNELTEFIQSKHWGYEMLSRFNKPITLATGFYGDEYLCRGPQQMSYLANSMGRHILGVINDSQYMFKYIHKYLRKNRAGNKLPFHSVNETEAKSRIFSDNANDFQIWHLNDVMTFCPYYDVRIINEVLKLKADILLSQALTANIQKEIINQTTPSVNMLADSYKNTIDSRVNFFKNIDKVKLSHCQRIHEA